MIAPMPGASYGTLFKRDDNSIGAIFGNIGSLPPGTNPFQYALDQIDALSGTASMHAPWFLANVAAIGIVFIFIVILHLSALIVPLLRGPRARSKHLWIVRSRYTGTFTQPYWVPNGRSLASVFSIITAAFVEGLIVMILWSPGSLNGAYYWLAVVPFFLVFCFVPFDAIYATSASTIRPEKKAWSDRTNNPWLINPLCWGVPVVVVVVESIFLARLWNMYPHLDAALQDFKSALAEAAAGYPTKGMMAADVPRLTRTGEALQQQSDAFNTAQIQTVICEASAMIYASALFFIALVLLLKAVWGRLGLRPNSRSKSIERTTIEQQQQQGGRISGSRVDNKTTDAVRVHRDVRRLYQLLVAYFSLLACLVFFITACLIYIWTNINTVQTNTHTRMVLLTALVWPICIMLAILGWLSLSRVLEFGRAKEDSTAGTDRSRGTPVRVGLFAFGGSQTRENKHDGYAGADSAALATPAGLATSEHHVQPINVSVDREASIEAPEEGEKEKIPEPQSL